MVSSDFGKLEVRRHLISGADWAIAGAATSVVAPMTALPLRNERRFMMYSLSWIANPLARRKEPSGPFELPHNELGSMCEGAALPVTGQIFCGCRGRRLPDNAGGSHLRIGRSILGVSIVARLCSAATKVRSQF